ncbi:MAG: tetratricopeptide repeat protein [Bacteroidota bacterium]
MAIILLLFSSFTAIASVNESLFEKANQSYKTGRFQEAFTIYKKINAGGEESSALYFNMGNACYRMQQYPLAILYYEKAAKLNPLDEEIQFNLKIANQKIVDRIEVMPKTFYQRWMNSIINLFSSFSWAVIVIILFVITLFMFAVYLFSQRIRIKKTAFWLSAGLVLIFSFSFIFAHKQYNRMNHHHEAILFVASVNVKSSPDDKGTDIFVLHAGTKVEIIDQLGEWREVRIANGAVGWMKAKELEQI